MHTLRKARLSATAVFAFICLMLFTLVPGLKASAANKYYTVGCTGGTISYYNSQAISFSSNANVSYYCSSKGSYTITVKPNSSTYSRTITIYSKKTGGATLDTLIITQNGVETRTLSTAPCTGSSLYYYNANAYSYSYSNTNVCSYRSGNYFVVKPNTTTSYRSCTVTVKNRSGNVLAYVYINQYGIPQTSISAACTGGNYAFTASGAYSYSYSNTAVCSSRSGNSFVVKPNTTTSARSCRVTVKNSAGNVMYYVNINQAAVPVKTQSVKGYATSFSYGKSGAVSLSPQKANVVSNITASNPGSFTIYVSANPSATAARTTDIIVKGSGGVYLEIIRLTQEKFTAPSYSYSYNSDPRTVTYTCSGADASKTAVSNSAMCSVTSAGSGKFSVKLTQNTSTAARTCTVTFKDKYGTAIEKCVITQKGVPLKTQSVVGSYTSFGYYKSGATSINPANKNMITTVTASNPGNFTIYVSANPSATATRTTDIIVKGNGGVYLEIIRVTQAKYTPPTVNYSVTSKRSTITYLNSQAAKFTYSYSYMCNSAKSLGSGKYQFTINANSYKARTETITVYDKYNTAIAKLVISQGAVKTYTVGSGTGENISYYNRDAVKFNLPINIKSVRCTSQGNFIFTQTVNRGTLTLEDDIEVLDASGNIIEYLTVISQPNVMRIKSSYDKAIPNAGKTFNVSFETSNPTTVTLTNATFSDGTTSKSINKNAVKANSYNTTTYAIKVNALSSSSSRQIKITITNGLETETKTLTQLGQQIGFRGCCADYPLGSLGRDHYVYRIVSSVNSSWTHLETVPLSDRHFDILSALSVELNESAGILDFALINGVSMATAGADNCFVTAQFYKDSSDNRYVLLTGSDSDTSRTFMNIPAAGIYGSDRSIDYKKNGVHYTGYIDNAHATSDNWIFWVDASGNLKMNIRKMGKDFFKVNGVHSYYSMGYVAQPAPGETIIQEYNPAFSKPYNVSARFRTMLNSLGK